MARPLFFSPIPLTDLDTQQIRSASPETGKAIFITTATKHFAVTVLLWVGIAAVTASCWFSAWSLGVAFARWAN